MKKIHIIFVLIALLSVVFVVFYINKSEKKVVYGIESQFMITKNDNDISNNVKQLDVCCGYIDKYFSNSLPEDEKSLTEIKNNIDIILNGKIYDSAFERSDFQKKLLADITYYKNDGILDESFLKKRYYAQLLTIKMKIDLVLGDYEEFLESFNEHYNTISISLPYYFCSYISVEPMLTKNEKALSVIVEAYENMLTKSKSTMDTYVILSDLYRLTFVENLSSDKKTEISKKFQDATQNNNLKKSYQGSNWISTGFETAELNPHQEFVFSYEITS